MQVIMRYKWESGLGWVHKRGRGRGREGTVMAIRAQAEEERGEDECAGEKGQYERP
jgi:hypothetical protein